MTEEVTTVPKDLEVLEAEKTQQFDDVIRYLLRISHEIEDIADVAARLINERRGKYNWVFGQNQAFLREYATERLKRGADGEIKGKNYKSLTAGGGVFFRGVPEKVHINQEHLGTLKAILAPYLGDTELITEKTVYEVPSKEALLEEVKTIIKLRAAAKHPQDEEVLQKLIEQGEDEIFGSGGIIQIEPPDALAHMSVGTTKGWSPKDAKAHLNKALDGKIIEQEDEVQALIEDLEA